MPGRRHGQYGSIKMDPTGAGGAGLVVVADLNAWTINMARESVDVTAFGDTNKQYVLGLPDVKGTFGGVWNAASAPTLFNVAMGTVAAMLNLIPSTLDPTVFFEGLAYLDAAVNVASNGAVTVSGNFVGAGPWTLEP